MGTVLANNGAMQFVIKKKSKPIKFVQNEDELHEALKEMDISVDQLLNKTYKIVGFTEFIVNLCRINGIELRRVMNDNDTCQQFVRSYSGCVGVLYQSLDYLD